MERTEDIKIFGRKLGSLERKEVSIYQVGGLEVWKGRRISFQVGRLEVLRG